VLGGEPGGLGLEVVKLLARAGPGADDIDSSVDHVGLIGACGLRGEKGVDVVQPLAGGSGGPDGGEPAGIGSPDERAAAPTPRRCAATAVGTSDPELTTGELGGGGWPWGAK
jgi:hypothetical protein